MASSSLSIRPSFSSTSSSSSSPDDFARRHAAVVRVPGFSFRLAHQLLSCQRRQTKVRMAVAEGQEASDSSSGSAVEKTMMLAPPALSRSKVNLPPRVCTLREFGEGMVALDTDQRVSSFFESLAANIEFTSKVQDWEILSGRLAMMVFVSALLLEAVTGNSVFEKMDSQRLLEICAAIVASMVVAAGFAVALQAKTRVAYTMSKGYESLMNTLIDNVIDSLLFDNNDDSV